MLIGTTKQSHVFFLACPLCPSKPRSSPFEKEPVLSLSKLALSSSKWRDTEGFSSIPFRRKLAPYLDTGSESSMGFGTSEQKQECLREGFALS